MTNTDPTPTRPVQHHPQRGGEGWNDDHTPVIDYVTWDLSYDCQLTISHDAGAREFTITVAMTEEDMHSGLKVRACTPAQLRAFARDLLALVEDHTEETPA